MKILLAGDDAGRVRLLTQGLGPDPSVTALRPCGPESLVAAVAAHAPDVILMDVARPGHAALESLRALFAHAPRPVALFVGHDDPPFMAAAIGAGASSYTVADPPPPDVRPILRATVTLFRQHQRTRAALSAAEARLQDRAMIERAKARLIRDRRLSEPEAYRWLRRNAMASGRRIADVARQVLGEDGAVLP